MKKTLSIVAGMLFACSARAGYIDSSGLDTNVFNVSKTAGTVGANTNGNNPRALVFQAQLLHYDPIGAALAVQGYAIGVSNQIWATTGKSYNVLSNSVAGDGTTDDTVAIQNLSTNGGVLKFDADHQFLGAGIVLTNNTYIDGQFAKFILKPGVTNKAFFTVPTGVTNIVFNGVKIDGLDYSTNSSSGRNANSNRVGIACALNSPGSILFNVTTKGLDYGLKLLGDQNGTAVFENGQALMFGINCYSNLYGFYAASTNSSDLTEYFAPTQLRAANNVYGAFVGGGNITIASAVLTENDWAVVVDGTFSNPAHGNIGPANLINHNQHGVLVANFLSGSGELIQGNQFRATATGNSVSISNSTTVVVTGNMFGGSEQVIIGAGSIPSSSKGPNFIWGNTYTGKWGNSTGLKVFDWNNFSDLVTDNTSNAQHWLNFSIDTPGDSDRYAWNPWWTNMAAMAMDGSLFTNLNASALVSGSVPSSLNFSNVGNTFVGSFNGNPSGGNGASSEAFGVGASANGSFDVAVGESTAANGNAQTALGYSAQVFIAGTNGVAVGAGSTVTGDSGIAIGHSSTAGSNSIAIGAGVTAANNTIVIGNRQAIIGNGSGLTNLANAPITVAGANITVVNTTNPVTGQVTNTIASSGGSQSPLTGTVNAAGNKGTNYSTLIATNANANAGTFGNYAGSPTNIFEVSTPALGLLFGAGTNGIIYVPGAFNVATFATADIGLTNSSAQSGADLAVTTTAAGGYVTVQASANTNGVASNVQLAAQRFVGAFMGDATLETNSVTWTHEGTATNITATFNGTLQTFTCTNGPSIGTNYFIGYAGANGSVSYRFTGTAAYNVLKFTYQPKWLAGSNSVITNGVLTLTSYGGTNATQLEAAMRENQ